MISLYGLFADTGSISSQLSNLSGIQPGDAAEIIRGELTHLVAQKTSSLATGFFIGIGIALWSASGGVMALIDALNVVYDEEEKRSFVKRAAIALLFTAGSIVFLLIALGAVIVLPIVLNFVGFWGLSDIVMRIIRCQSHTLVVLSLVYLGGLRWPFLISDGQ
jgi:membrane protein